MDTAFTLSKNDHDAAHVIINQLAECQTRIALIRILKKLLYPLIGCHGAFYIQTEREAHSPSLLGNTRASTHCQCWWDFFYHTAKQNHFLANSLVIEKYWTLATEDFCYTNTACSSCSVDPKNTLNPNYNNSAIAVLLDSASPTIELYFYKFSSQPELYSKREIKLLQLVRATLLQTVNAVIYREEYQKLQHVLNHLPGQNEPLAVIDNNGNLIYKNQAFEQAVDKEKYRHLFSRLGHKTAEISNNLSCTSYLSQLGHRLYEVNLTQFKAIACNDTSLNFLKLCRVTDKKLQMSRKLDKAGLSHRELEITALIFQGISAQNISQHLNLSYHTVRNHIKHIYRKIGVSTRGEMLTWKG